MELVIVVGLLGILVLMAAPPLQRMRERAALQNGRHMITSALSLASASGTTWGRTSVLRLDADLDELRIVVDTGATGEPVVVREYRMGEDLGLEILSNRESLCFNSRGVGTMGLECPAVGGRIILSYGALTDTLVINAVGRVHP